MVEQLYAWKAINVETHLKEVWAISPALTRKHAEFPARNGLSRCGRKEGGRIFPRILSLEFAGALECLVGFCGIALRDTGVAD